MYPTNYLIRLILPQFLTGSLTYVTTQPKINLLPYKLYHTMPMVRMHGITTFYLILLYGMVTTKSVGTYLKFPTILLMFQGTIRYLLTLLHQISYTPPVPHKYLLYLLRSWPLVSLWGLPVCIRGPVSDVALTRQRS